MKPIDEMWDHFAYEFNSPDLYRAMESFLHRRYPEAKAWHVESNNKNGVTVTVEFHTAEEQSFYLLKWT